MLAGHGQRARKIINLTRQRRGRIRADLKPRVENPDFGVSISQLVHLPSADAEPLSRTATRRPDYSSRHVISLDADPQMISLKDFACALTRANLSCP
jgi:hypothetical protein